MEITKEHFRLIEYQLSTFDVNQCVEDDLRSAGNLGLLRAVRSYPDTGNSAKFETFAVTCIRNAMINELRDLNTKKATVAQFIDGGIIEETAEGETTPEQILIDKEQQALAWSRLLEILPLLSYRQKYILQHRIHCEDGDMETQGEIASRFKCNQSTIQREEKKLYGYLRQTYPLQ